MKIYVVKFGNQFYRSDQLQEISAYFSKKLLLENRESKVVKKLSCIK